MRLELPAAVRAVRRRLPHAVGQARALLRARGGRGHDPLPGYTPPAEAAEPGERPARADRRRVALVPELDVRQRARAAAPRRRRRRRAAPRRRGRARACAAGERVRVGNERGAFEAVLAVGDAVAPRASRRPPRATGRSSGRRRRTSTPRPRSATPTWAAAPSSTTARSGWRAAWARRPRGRRRGARLAMLQHVTLEVRADQVEPCGASGRRSASSRAAAAGPARRLPAGSRARARRSTSCTVDAPSVAERGHVAVLAPDYEDALPRCASGLRAEGRAATPGTRRARSCATRPGTASRSAAPPHPPWPGEARARLYLRAGYPARRAQMAGATRRRWTRYATPPAGSASQ